MGLFGAAGNQGHLHPAPLLVQRGGGGKDATSRYALRELCAVMPQSMLRIVVTFAGIAKGLGALLQVARGL